MGLPPSVGGSGGRGGGGEVDGKEDGKYRLFVVLWVMMGLHARALRFLWPCFVGGVRCSNGRVRVAVP